MVGEVSCEELAEPETADEPGADPCAGGARTLKRVDHGDYRLALVPADRRQLYM